MALELTTFISDNATLLSALFGGAGVKLLDKLLSKRGDAFSEATKIREELRSEIDTLRAEISARRTESDSWRGKYWEQVEENIQLKSEMESMKLDLEELKKQVVKIAQSSGSVL
jgi:peptidoglycan hydrolase CwlO-like protein